MANGKKKVGVEIVVSAVDRATQQFKEINKRLQNSPLAQLNKNMQQISKSSGLSNVSNAMSKFGKATNHAVGEFGSLLARVGALAGIGGGGLFALSKSYADFADKIDDTAVKLGTSMQFVQRYGVIAGLAGVDQEVLNKSMDKFSKNLGEATLQGGALRQTFAKLGVNVLNKNFRKLDVSLPVVLEKLSKLENANVRNAVGARLFGKQFGELVPMIKEFDKLNDQAGGLILSNEEIENGIKLDETFNSLFTTFKAIKNIAGAAIAPGMVTLLKEFQGFLVTNKQGIKDFFTAVGKELPGAFRTLAAAMKSVTSLFTTINKDTGEVELRMGRLKALFAGIALILSGPFLVSLISLAVSFGQLMFAIGAFAMKVGLFLGPILSWLNLLGSIIVGALLTPWGLIAAAVVGVGLLVWKYWEPISEMFLSIWESMKGIGSAAANFFGFNVGQSNAPAAPVTPAQIVGGAMSTSKQEASVSVSFDNMPKGAKVDSSSSSELDFTLDRGFAFGGF